MPKLIKMPKLSDTMTEGTLVKWHIKEGDAITLGTLVADVETDKATMEMEAFEEGTVHKLLVGEGGKIGLGANMVVLLAEGEEVPADLDALLNSGAAAPAKEEKSASSGSKRSGSSLPQAPKSKRRSATAANGARVKASPLARKVAEELNVDLSRVEATGPGGRIVRDDVVNASRSGNASAPAPAKAVQTIRPVMGPEDERIPLTGMRNVIAERLFASKTQIPHFYLQTEVDAGPLMAFRAHINKGNEATNGNKYTVNDFVLKAVVNAAAAVPAVNASFDGDSIVQFKHVNLSVAIAIPEGLVTPVIREAQNKTMLQISQSVKDLAGKAKNKKLSPDDFAGGTITVSNLGAFGVDQFAAIINPPQAAIISIGSIRKTPVVNDKGEIVVGQRMWVGLSGDHRVVDGAVAATFLAEIRKLIENPTLMLI